MIRSIGADQVIDYTDEDFTKSGQHYDLIFDCYAKHSPSGYGRVLNPRGIYVGVGPPVDLGGIGILARLIQMIVLSWMGSQKLVTFLAKPSKEDLTILRDLVATGKVTPVIDRCYSLNEVPEAMRYLEEGHARGKVVITLAE
jgi:NADPH:quinone reductase-like Zn-dependent oxidoreductase